MEEQLISFETAKLAKEKEFEIPCYYYYNNNGNLFEPYLENGSSTDVEFRIDLTDLLENRNYKHNNTISAPTQSLLQKWLREQHSIEVTVMRYTYSGGVYQGRKYMWVINQYDEKYNHELPEDDSHWIINETQSQGYEFNSYEEALEVGLQEALKLIK